MFAYIASGLDDCNDVENYELLFYLLISYLLKKMGKFSPDMEEVQVRIKFEILYLFLEFLIHAN